MMIKNTVEFICEKIVDKIFFYSDGRNKYVVATFPFKIFRVSSKEDAFRISKMLKKQRLNKIFFPDYFSLELILTTRCNLGCDYCYAKRDVGTGYYGLRKMDMDKKVVKKAVHFLMDMIVHETKRNGVTEARFDVYYMGGEPLLNKNVLRYSMDYLTRIIGKIEQKEDIVIHLHPAISTNGTLLNDSDAKFFEKYNFDYVAITIDGEAHDQHRKYTDGSGTLKDILHNIETLFEHGVRLKLVSVVPPGEVDDIDNILNFYKKLGLLQRAYRVSIIPRAPTMREINRSCIIPKRYFNEITDRPSLRSYSEQERVAFGKKLIEISDSFKIDERDLKTKMFNLIKQGGTSYRCLAGIAKFSVIPNGNVYPCHQLVNVPPFFMGNISDIGKKFKVVSSKFKNRTVFKLDKCKDCMLQTMCPPLVDCPARSYIEKNSMYRVAQYCDIYLPYLNKCFGEFVECLENKDSA